MTTELTTASAPKSLITPKNMEEALRFADVLAKSNIVPKEYQGNPGNVLVAMQWGMEIGLQPLQAMQNIAVINGRPSVWGDAALALVRGSGLLEQITEECDGETAVCTVVRKGESPTVRSFSMEDAKRAGLAGKQGPWTQYPKRMLQMRARAFALRDVFADVLRGIGIAEEERDRPAERDMGEAQVVRTASSRTEALKNKLCKKADATAALPEYPEDRFAENLPKWADLIDAGKKTPEQIREMVASQYTLTATQLQALASLGAPRTKEEGGAP